jgi:hypothetical protein
MWAAVQIAPRVWRRRVVLLWPNDMLPHPERGDCPEAAVLLGCCNTTDGRVVHVHETLALGSAQYTLLSVTTTVEAHLFINRSVAAAYLAAPVLRPFLQDSDLHSSRGGSRPTLGTADPASLPMPSAGISAAGPAMSAGDLGWPCLLVTPGWQLGGVAAFMDSSESCV